MGKNVCSFPVLVVSLSAKKPAEHPFQRSDTRFTKEVRENLGKNSPFSWPKVPMQVPEPPRHQKPGVGGEGLEP
jgi:hypothetical protein